MHQLPQSGFVRLPQIIGDKKHGIPAVIPVSKSAWWEGCKNGRYPQPLKLGPRTTVWRVSDILALIADDGRAAQCCGSKKPSAIELAGQA